MSRQGNLAGIVAGLTAVLEEIKTADGDKLQVVGWRGQQAHTPPSAWLNLTPVSTTHERGGKLIDVVPFELWLTRPPGACEADEIDDLAALADLALPIVDEACKGTAALGRFGIQFIGRAGFSFRTADQADGDGASLTVPALLIPIVARWSGTYC